MAYASFHLFGRTMNEGGYRQQLVQTAEETATKSLPEFRRPRPESNDFF